MTYLFPPLQSDDFSAWSCSIVCYQKCDIRTGGDINKMVARQLIEAALSTVSVAESLKIK